MTLHIEYSHNGRTVSDVVYDTIAPGTGFTAADISSAKQAAWELLDRMGCGSVSLYVQSPASRRYIAL